MQFLCPNCNVISDKFQIGDDLIKKSEVKEISDKIEKLKSEQKLERNKFLGSMLLIRVLDQEILNASIRKRECETQYHYIKCEVCGFKHYIKVDEDKWGKLDESRRVD